MTAHVSNLTKAPLANRRGLFALGGAGLLLAALPQSAAVAQAAAGAQAAAPVEQLNNALLASMRAGGTPFEARYRALAPVIERVFDLDAVLSRSVGLSWPSLPAAEKSRLEAAFEHYTVSSYVANFNSYDGQRFTVSPSVRQVGGGDVVVRSQLTRASGDPVTLDYVMRSGPGGWRVVDVLMDGAISRVAVQRSDFRQLLATGGVPALVASLEHKVANLSGGMVG